MRVQVTGGAGFIGSHIVQHIQGRAEVRVLDNLRTGREGNLNLVERPWATGYFRGRKG